MTTAAMVLGVVPLVLANGAGAIARNMLGWTIIGGMVMGTIFSLLVVPTFYLYLTKPKTINHDLDMKINEAIDRAKNLKREK
jgi:multidrug efflux pump